MCGGMEYEVVDLATGQRIRKKAFFPIPKVQIPVIDEDGLHWSRWGKRKGEDPEIDVPVTGWARLISLTEGKWNPYKPRKVCIPAVSWMEKNPEKQSYWFDMEPEQYLLGVEIEKEVAGQPERFVYVVTKPSQGMYSLVHERMPMIISGIRSGKSYPMAVTTQEQHQPQLSFS